MNNLNSNLSESKISSRSFEDLVLECAYDESWCALHKIDYLNPNFDEISATLYQELLIYKKNN